MMRAKSTEWITDAEQGYKVRCHHVVSIDQVIISIQRKGYRQPLAFVFPSEVYWPTVSAFVVAERHLDLILLLSRREVGEPKSNETGRFLLRASFPPVGPPTWEVLDEIIPGLKFHTAFRHRASTSHVTERVGLPKSAFLLQETDAGYNPAAYRRSHAEAPPLVRFQGLAG